MLFRSSIYDVASTRVSPLSHTYLYSSPISSTPSRSLTTCSHMSASHVICPHYVDFLRYEMHTRVRGRYQHAHQGNRRLLWGVCEGHESWTHPITHGRPSMHSIIVTGSPGPPIYSTWTRTILTYLRILDRVKQPDGRQD